MAFVQAQEFQLAGSGCSATATSIVITGFTLPDGTKLTQAMFGTKGFGTLEPGTSREESISFTGITDNSDGTQTITGVTRGLQFQSPHAEDADLKFKHAGSSIFVLSNTSAFYADQFFNTQDDQEIDGQITFNTEPLSGYGDPTSGTAFATKDYADGLGGATSYNRTVISGTGGATIAAGDVVFLDVADQEWKLADADTAYSFDTQFGIAQGAGSDGVTITNGVLIAGKDQTQTGLTPGEGYYISTTAGDLTATEPTNSVFVGIAESATVLLVDFQKDKQSPVQDFVTTSAGAGDEGKGVKLNASGVLDSTFLNAQSSPTTITVDIADSPYTWTKDAGLKYIEVEIWGGGAGGGGGTGGGGGGACHKIKLFASQLGDTETVTIGAGGSAGSGGGTSNFGTLAYAYGGATSPAGANRGGGGGGGIMGGGSNAASDNGGTGGSPTGGSAGVASYAGGGGGGQGNGNTSFNPGGTGGQSYCGGAGGGGGATNTNAAGGAGGNAIFGGAGGGAYGTTGTAAGGVSKYGGNGGDSGAVGSVPGGGGGHGASGGDGRCVIKEYYI